MVVIVVTENWPHVVSARDLACTSAVTTRRLAQAPAATTMGQFLYHFQLRLLILSLGLQTVSCRLSTCTRHMCTRVKTALPSTCTAQSHSCRRQARRTSPAEVGDHEVIVTLCPIHHRLVNDHPPCRVVTGGGPHTGSKSKHSKYERSRTLHPGLCSNTR